MTILFAVAALAAAHGTSPAHVDHSAHSAAQHAQHQQHKAADGHKQCKKVNGKTVCTTVKADHGQHKTHDPKAHGAHKGH